MEKAVLIRKNKEIRGNIMQGLSNKEKAIMTYEILQKRKEKG